MSNQLILYNACYFNGRKNIEDAIIYIKEGKIHNVLTNQEFEIDKIIHSGVKCLDCKNMYILPSWIDSHLHIPGMLLYELFGLNLLYENSVEGYLKKIESYEQYNGEFVRGYGWNASVCERVKNGYKLLKTSLDKSFENIPAIIFSDDYHSCIINNTLLSLISKKYPDIAISRDGFLAEKEVFQLLSYVEEISFEDNMIEKAILEFQGMLISKGITSIQALMFLGGNNQKEWNILNKLDQQGKIFIKINIAVNIYPYDTIDDMFQRINRIKKYSSNHIKVNTVKLYLDGVVDNKTAFLTEPYESENFCGTNFWDMELLKRVCQFFDLNGIQIHIHAIGDAAVKDAVTGLCYAMDINKTRGKNRHVITHLQLSCDEDIKKMDQYGIIAAVQPYWFPQEDNYYYLDKSNLGKRVFNEYRMGTLFANNVIVTSSSDCPVTKNPDPLVAIEIAINRKNKEKVSVLDMLDSFTINGAFQLGIENAIGRIDKGFCGDLIVLSKNILNGSVESAKLLYTIIDGEIKYSNNSK